MGSGNSRNAWRWVALCGTVAAGVTCFFVAWGGLSTQSLPATETIPQGTVLIVRLAHSLSSNNARLGQAFEGRVISAYSPKGPLLIRPGTRVVGKCVAVRRAEGGQRPGYVRLALFRIASEGSPSPVPATTFAKWGNRAISFSTYPVPPRPTTGDEPLANSELGDESDAASHEAVITTDESLSFTLLQPLILPQRRARILGLCFLLVAAQGLASL
jgi:hypothetical protein